MSGGSWGYAYQHVEGCADRCRRSPDPVRRAFADHLTLVAAALHDIEWVDSADKSAGDEHEAIMALIGEHGLLGATVVEARDVYRRLSKLLDSPDDPPPVAS